MNRHDRNHNSSVDANETYGQRLMLQKGVFKRVLKLLVMFYGSFHVQVSSKIEQLRCFIKSECVFHEAMG